MGGGVLGPHVDDHRLVVFGPEAPEDDLVPLPAELLRALVGLGLETRLLGAGHLDRLAHRGAGFSLNSTGILPAGSSLRSGYPTQSSGMSRRVRSGWPSKTTPNMS